MSSVQSKYSSKTPSKLPRVVPRVVIDARMVSDIPHGISRYVGYLAKSLAGLSPLSYEPVFLVNSTFSSIPAGINPLGTKFPCIPVTSPFLSPSELFEIPQVLKRLNASLYHSPSFSSLGYCPCPWIVTLHDLNHLTYGELSKKLYYKFLLRRFAKKAKVVITVSQFSRREISDWLGISQDKIQIVSNVIERPKLSPLASQQSILEKYKLEKGRYFLCVSNPKPHKNLPLLVEAYQKFSASQKIKAWPLVLTVREFGGIDGVHALGGLSEEETGTLLSNAGGLFFPSLYEGFGLPPLEGAVVGTRLAVSRIPPHEEGLADLAPNEVLWVDPKDQEGWTSAFHKMTDDQIARPSPDNQKKILEHFSSVRMGESMDQIYRTVLGFGA